MSPPGGAANVAAGGARVVGGAFCVYAGAMEPDFSFELALRARGVWPVAGLDEAGRGPLAGPVAAAAVILDPDDIPAGLNDSKRLPKGTREALYYEILRRALAVSVAFASAAEIDAADIRRASLIAMRRAAASLATQARHALIDGRDLVPGLPCPGEAIIKGDARSASIAAASIVAKVTRDRAMTRLCAQFPAYGFSRHAGYPTRAHLAAIAEHGPCPHHRMSFRPFSGRTPA